MPQREYYVETFVAHLRDIGLRAAVMDAHIVEGVHIWVQGHHVVEPDDIVWLMPDGKAVWGKDRQCSATGLNPLELAYAVLESLGGHGAYCA